MEKTYYAPGGVIAAGKIRPGNADVQKFASSVPSGHSGGPLPSLAEQLQRVAVLRSRVGALAERVIGPRGSGVGQAEAPTAYGGILGALEGETATLRRYISEMLDDIGAIESALS